MSRALRLDEIYLHLYRRRQVGKTGHDVSPTASSRLRGRDTEDLDEAEEGVKLQSAMSLRELPVASSH